MSAPPAVAALRRAYPVELPDDAAATAWWGVRRDVLLRRVTDDGDAALAVSSGCAAGGAHRHRSGLVEQADRALQRLHDGTLVDCAACGHRLDFARLDAAPGAVDCTTCRRAAAGSPDTRWCR